MNFLTCTGIKDELINRLNGWKQLFQFLLHLLSLLLHLLCIWILDHQVFIIINLFFDFLNRLNLLFLQVSYHGGVLHGISHICSTNRQTFVLHGRYWRDGGTFHKGGIAHGINVKTAAAVDHAQMVSRDAANLWFLEHWAGGGVSLLDKTDPRLVALLRLSQRHAWLFVELVRFWSLGNGALLIIREQGLLGCRYLRGLEFIQAGCSHLRWLP